MTTNRREFIAGTGAAIASLTSLAAFGNRNAVVAAAPDVRAALSRIAEDMLIDYPENATSLGIDTSPRAALKARLTDRSADGQHAIAKRVAERLARLKSVDASKLEDAVRVDLDVVRTAHETATDGFAFPYGDVALLNSNWSWRNAPYVVAQNTGAFLEIPSLLEEQHTLTTREDAEAYLERLTAYAGQIDGETGRLKAARAQSVIAPDFILDKTLAQLKLARSGDVADWPFIAFLAKKTKDLRARLCRQGHKDCDRRDRPGPRTPVRGAGGAPQTGNLGRRRVEAAAGRCLLRMGAARRDHDAHDAGRDSRAWPGGAQGAPGGDGHDPEGPGPDAGHGR